MASASFFSLLCAVAFHAFREIFDEEAVGIREIFFGDRLHLRGGHGLQIREVAIGVRGISHHRHGLAQHAGFARICFPFEKFCRQ